MAILKDPVSLRKRSAAKARARVALARVAAQILGAVAGWFVEIVARGERKMGRAFARAAKAVALLLLVGIALVLVLFFIALKYSTVKNEYTCEGYTTVGEGPPEEDHGRLQILHYRFWVALWNDKSVGDATFQSTKLTFFESSLIASGEGHFTTYMGRSQDQVFSFRRATNELLVSVVNITFKGNCIRAL
jgi:hypothetical protein